MPLLQKDMNAVRLRRVVARIEERRELARHDKDGGEQAEAAFAIALSLIREEFRNV